jgi:nicotinamidase-related amidase
MGKYTDPDWESSALVTIDTQNDFTLPGAPSEIAGTVDVLPVLRSLVGAFREAGRPIFHVVRLYRPDGSNVDSCRREAVESGVSLAVQPGSAGAELVDELKPSPEVRLDAEALLGGRMQEIGEREWVMYKPRWGAFFETPLHDHLRGLGVNTLVVCGCNFPNCPRTTIYEASERDYRIVAVAHAISGVYERGMRELQGIGVEPMGTQRCLEGLGAEKAALPRSH